MIKVIGQLDPANVKRVACGNCANVLEYTMADTHEVKRTDYTGSTDIYRALKCPVCEKDIILWIAG